MIYLITYTCFEICRENDKERKKYKEKNIGHAWIRTTVHMAVGLQERIGHHVMYTILEQFTYIPFNSARQIKMHRVLI